MKIKKPIGVKPRKDGDTNIYLFQNKKYVEYSDGKAECYEFDNHGNTIYYENSIDGVTVAILQYSYEYKDGKVIMDRGINVKTGKGYVRTFDKKGKQISFEEFEEEVECK